ncbi:MAG: hypothetical protein DLM59_16240 [Pseudonocardiales bacterium]|nr:MAG: hypothetical protein DLM59_16240 [Pseudonocardiales bacterium]
MRGLLAALSTAMLLGGCATQSTQGGHDPGRLPGGQQPAFAAFTITRTGGFAGVSQRIDVASDGTVRNEAGTVIGHIEPADLTQLRSLLTGKEIRDEATRGKSSGSGKCADGFNVTLVMGDLRVSDYTCGRPSNKPAFSRVLELTSGSHVKR